MISDKSAHFDIDSERKKIDPKALGPTFKLCDQDFQCLPALPAGVMNRIASAMRLDNRGKVAFDAPNVMSFIEDSLITRRWIAWEFEGEDAAAELTDEQRTSVTEDGGYWEPADDRQRFAAIIEDTEDIVDLEDAAKLMNHLMEYYGERPTRRSKR